MALELHRPHRIVFRSISLVAKRRTRKQAVPKAQSANTRHPESYLGISPNWPKCFERPPALRLAPPETRLFWGSDPLQGSWKRKSMMRSWRLEDAKVAAFLVPACFGAESPEIKNSAFTAACSCKATRLCKLKRNIEHSAVKRRRLQHTRFPSARASIIRMHTHMFVFEIHCNDGRSARIRVYPTVTGGGYHVLLTSRPYSFKSSP